MRIATYLVIVLFAVFLSIAAYYLFGGPVPHSITWGGDLETPFTGSYFITTDPVEGSYHDLLEAQGTDIEATYPHTERFWVPRTATILASTTPQVDRSIYNSITIDRFGVECARTYQWGERATVECDRIF